MSSFTMKARHKRTEEMLEAFVIDGPSGVYSYVVLGWEPMTEEEFNRLFERVEEA